MLDDHALTSARHFESLGRDLATLRRSVFSCFSLLQRYFIGQAHAFHHCVAEHHAISYVSDPDPSISSRYPSGLAATIFVILLLIFAYFLCT